MSVQEMMNEKKVLMTEKLAKEIRYEQNDSR